MTATTETDNLPGEQIEEMDRASLTAAVMELGWDRVRHTSTTALRAHVRKAFADGLLTREQIADLARSAP